MRRISQRLAEQAFSRSGIAQPREHELDRGSGGIDGAVELAPTALDTNVGLILIRTCLGAFAARVFAAMVGGGAFLLALVFVFTAGSQVIAQTITVPNITSEGPFLVDEGETAVATLTADDNDTDAGDLIWSKTGGADSAKFSLTSAGVLTFSAAKDYEAPDDADTDGTYEVTVQVSDGSETDAADLVVTLENVVELTTLTGPSTVDYEENRAVRVATYSASSEADQDGLTWSLSGEDASSFSIDEPEGVLRFDLAVVSPNLFSPQPDYDAPADDDSDGTYEVTVEVGDGVTSHSLAVEVTITDQDEAGTLTLSTTRPQFGGALTTTLTDPDGVSGMVTYQLGAFGRSQRLDGHRRRDRVELHADQRRDRPLSAGHGDLHGRARQRKYRDRAHLRSRHGGPVERVDRVHH